MRAPKVSICVPTYNGREHLKECLDSIQAQSYRDFEVVVCDDQSADGTLDLARELTRGDERFRFVANPQRFGLVGNWNNCVSVSRGEWIKFVFQDDIILPSCIDKLLRACESTGKPFGFCARDFIFEAGTSETTKGWFLAHQAALAAKYKNRTTVEASQEDLIDPQGLSRNPVGEPTVTLIRKSVFETVGLFDGALIQLCDTEFWFRVLSNFGAAWVPEVLASFRSHGKGTTACNERSRRYRAHRLDQLVMLYRFAFDARFSRLRASKLTRQSAFGLRLDCAAAAYRARREACRSAAANDDPSSSLMREWNSITPYCPRLELLAGIGRWIAGYQRVIKDCGGSPDRSQIR